MSEHKNQRQRILDLLLAASGSEVPSVALSRISLQYGARVKELRALGFQIKASVPVHRSVPAVVAMADAVPSSLFGDLTPGSRYPE